MLERSASTDAITARLREARAGASAEHVLEGRAWYPGMGRLIAEIAAECGVSKSVACGTFAAFSQNATWKANVSMATNRLAGRPQGGLKSVIREVERIEAGEDPAEVIGALKRPDFYRNLMGMSEYVTCDRWHLRAAYGNSKVPLTAEVRERVTEATRRVAAEFDETPMACQAVIWCAIRGTGK